MEAGEASLKLISLIVISLIVIFISFLSCPVTNLDSIIRIDETYIERMEQQYILSSLFASLAACSTGYAIKTRRICIPLAILISSVIWVAFINIEEPEFRDMFFMGLLDFPIFFFSIGFVFFLLLLVINSKWPRLK